MARVLAITLNPALDLSIALDQLAPGTVQRASATQTMPAGKGNNVARVLAAQGHEVTVSGFLGSDNAGAFEAVFAAWGVDDAFVRVAGATRTNVKLSEDDGRVTDINAAGIHVSPDDWTRLERRLGAIGVEAVDAVVLAGSLPPGVAPAQLAALIGDLRARGVAVWLDTSGAALAAAVAAGPSVIKPNTKELAELTGHSVDTAAACERAAATLRADGVESVCVSRGAEGFLWCRAGRTWSVWPPAVNVISTVCAGDTLLAGLLHGRLEKWDETATLRFAAALSVAAVRQLGVGDANAPDFDALCAQIEMERLDLSRVGADALSPFESAIESRLPDEGTS